MIKNFSGIELKIAERFYKFICDVDSPIGEVHDILNQMKGIVLDKMNDLHQAKQPEKSQSDENPCCASVDANACNQEAPCQ